VKKAMAMQNLFFNPEQGSLSTHPVEHGQILLMEQQCSIQIMEELFELRMTNPILKKIENKKTNKNIGCLATRVVIHFRIDFITLL